jgi:DNA-binding transcriptional MerR regulator
VSEAPATRTLDQPAGLRRGQVAAAAGLNIETLRYYERRGLLAAPDRSPGGHRLYPPETITVLRVIKAGQRLGFTLEEVADLLELGRHRHGKRVDAGLQQRAVTKLVEVEERIADLTAIRENLAAALDAGCDDLVACAGSQCCPIPFEALTLHPDSQPAPPTNAPTNAPTNTRTHR